MREIGEARIRFDRRMKKAAPRRSGAARGGSREPLAA